MININELSPALRLFLEHTLKPLSPILKTKVLKEITEQAKTTEHFKAFLNLMNGMNYPVFKKFCDEHPDDCTLENFEKHKIKTKFGLNPEQMEALIHNHKTMGPLLILAGAGSGKTAVLTRRIIYLLLCGVAPENILSVTFTNKAAGEMKERVINIIKEIYEQTEGLLKEELLQIIEKIPDMWISTFHSSCLRLLYEDCLGKKNFERVGFTIRPDIIPTLAQKSLFEKLYEIAKIRDVDLDDVISRIDEAKNELYSVDYFKKNASGKIEKKVAFIYEEYQKELAKRNQVDFNDIIMFCAEIFENFPDVLKYYQDKFQYILVDEYQDTNFAQYLLIYKLASQHRRLFVVGDDDQSIYGWRGADIRNILNFKKDFQDAFIVKFERNYRSSQTILSAANAVFVNKPPELRKILKVTKNDDKGNVFHGEKIILFEAEDEYDEVNYCIFEIQKILNERETSFEKNKIKFFEDNYQHFQYFLEKMYEFYNIINSLNNHKLAEKFEEIYLKVYTLNNLLISEYQQQKLKDETILNYLNAIYLFNDLISEELEEEHKNYLSELVKYISSYVNDFKKKVFKYNQFAIFYRINNQKNLVKEILTKNKIPFNEIGDTRFFEFREIINIMIFFELVIGISKYYRKDDKLNIGTEINQKFAELLSLPFYNLSVTDKTVIVHQTPKIPIIDEEEIEKIRNRLSVSGKSTFNFLLKCLSRVFQLSEKAPLVEIYNIAIEALFYKEKIEEDFECKTSLRKNLEHFKELLIDFDNLFPLYKNIFDRVTLFIQDLRAKQTDPQCQLNKNDGVNLMTLHSAKGLEFPVVFFIGVEEDICPHKHPGTELSMRGEEERIDEERRLFYVGITRAQERLYLIHAIKRKWYGKIVYHKPSRFLKALPEETLLKGKSNRNIFKRIIIKIKRILNKII
ncbi:MAG TPA: UvrD-helicase domain-containing protein [bacterium]|nr:UvrD-helicase domain-containing protein [bacterium]HOL47086.1 UvrD-helicase domain-containing protein [bacterium]HPQ18986.1 UvrD-helicase domain-containing protein [bacterium]